MNRLTQRLVQFSTLEAAYGLMAASRKVSTLEDGHLTQCQGIRVSTELGTKSCTSQGGRSREPSMRTTSPQLTRSDVQVHAAQAGNRGEQAGNDRDQAGNHGNQAHCQESQTGNCGEAAAAGASVGTRAEPCRLKGRKSDHGDAPHRKSSRHGSRNASHGGPSCRDRGSKLQRDQSSVSSADSTDPQTLDSAGPWDSAPDFDGRFLFALDVEGLLMERSPPHTEEHVSSGYNDEWEQRGGKRQLDVGSEVKMQPGVGSEGKVSEAKQTRKGKGTLRKGKNTVSPNAFVSIRVRSPSIRLKMEEVQAVMEEKEPKVVASLVSLEKLHVTMMVVNLHDKEQIEKAKAALHDAAMEALQVLRVLEEPLVLQFKGVGSFGEQVVYASLKDDEAAKRLLQLADIVAAVFARNGFQSAGTQRAFSPHLTIAKTRYPHNRGGRLKREIYAELLETEFGNEPVTGLELLSMTLPADKDGYYHCFQSCAFAELLQQ